ETLEPVEYLPLDVRRRVVAAGDTRVHGGGERLGEYAHDRRGRVDPAIKARMPVAKGIRLDVSGEFGQNLLGALAGLRDIRTEEAFRQLAWEGSKDRPLGERGQVLGEEVHHQVAHVADGVWGPFPVWPGLWRELQGSTLTH